MAATVWCPSCGDEYVAGSTVCAECRVALVSERPAELTPSGADGPSGALPEGYVELGSWPRLAAVLLVRRLEDAGVPVASLWAAPDEGGETVLGVPEPQATFADAVVRELPVDEEMPAGTVDETIDRIETRLAEVALLLDDLRSRLAGGGGGDDAWG